ncbi:acyltransferase family protein [Cupriavidus sp. CuC1]|uniref:acyltransferase family protein n=1 Tax=Cupriavidus sp. CuC1 TaxID=3373131 RepID=UPI0037D39AD7
MNFRKDINGLRALAVVAVVLFHFGVPGMNGGFVGVDVFFVISGFLMTGIIFRKIDDGTFSVSTFYFDRARRIIPALAFLCFFILVFGWFFLTPTNYRALGKHVASTLGFVSNVVFLLESDYFDNASQAKWLLHTWSLSVEWQFYLLYPLIILLIRKWHRLLSERWVLLGFAGSSFLLSAYLSSRFPSTAFYLLPTRAWELLAGALAYIFQIRLSKRGRLLMEIAGLALIIFAIFSTNATDTWPGWLASVPVLGTALVIVSARSASPLTGNPVAQFIGRTSYSIYLWHWPLAVGLYYCGKTGQPLWIAGGIAASLLMGCLSYYFVENFPGISSKNIKKMNLSIGIGCIIVITALSGATIFLLKGLPSRMPGDFTEKTKDLVMPLPTNGWCFYSVDSISALRVGPPGLKCEIGDRTSAVRGLLFGDSFAGHNDPFWDAIGSRNHVRINSIATNWCYPSLTQTFLGPVYSRSREQCQINRRYFSDHVGDYDFVILSGSWASVLSRNKMQDVYDAVDFSSRKAKLVILMAAPTAFDMDPVFSYENAVLLGIPFDIRNIGREADRSTRDANAAIKLISKKYANVIYLDRESLFNVDGIPSDVTKENVPYSFGGNHISVYGSNSSALAFEQMPLYRELRQRLASLHSAAEPKVQASR